MLLQITIDTVAAIITMPNPINRCDPMLGVEVVALGFVVVLLGVVPPLGPVPLGVVPLGVVAVPKIHGAVS